MSDEIWDFLYKRKNIIDGVVFTGGEPTLHPNLKNLITEVRSLGYQIKLDTNGLLPEIIKDFSPDYLAVDIKTTPELYTILLKATYYDIRERLEKSLAIVKKMENNAEVRITVAPKIINEKVIRDLLPLLEGVELVCLQPVDLKKVVLDRSFFNGTNSISLHELKRYQELISPVVRSCIIREEH
jgi:pyruvate formate lyase activating enzyme